MNSTSTDIHIDLTTGNFSRKLLEEAIEKVRSMSPDDDYETLKAGRATILVTRDRARMTIVFARIRYRGLDYFVGR